MTTTTRLDPVLKVRTDAELTARRRLASAVAHAEAARRTAEEARDVLISAEAVCGGAAWMADVQEVGFRRSLEDWKKAEQMAARTAEIADDVRTEHVAARMRMKVIERVVEERRAHATQEAARKEQRELDERTAARFA